MFTNVVGTLASIASLTIIVFGVPVQIIKNYKNKNCDSFAPLLVYSSAFSCFIWTLYGFLKPDLFLIIAQVPASFLTIIFLTQFFYYRRKNGKK